MSDASEIVSPFPDTSYVDEVMRGMHPLEVGLVRAVCVAERFGQADAQLTDQFAANSAIEVSYWLEDERPDYEMVRSQTESFFRTGGAHDLAEAAMAGIEGAEASLTRNVRAGFIQRSWDICNRQLPTGHKLRSLPPVHQRLIEQNRREEEPTSLRQVMQELAPGHLFGGAWQVARDNKRHSALAGLFMCIDATRIDEGRKPGTFDVEPRESMARELVLARRVTGSAACNLLGDRLQWVVAARMVRADMKNLRRAWGVHHPDEPFLPEQYQDMLDTLPHSERSVMNTVRALAALMPSPKLDL